MEIEKLDSDNAWYRASYKNCVSYGTSPEEAEKNCRDHYSFLTYDGSDEMFMQKMDVERSPVEFASRE